MIPIMKKNFEPHGGHNVSIKKLKILHKSVISDDSSPIVNKLISFKVDFWPGTDPTHESCAIVM